jgi:NAD(P)-dependent dehydrogenase (short-subunit alcohol dehydrogenase family)
MSRERTQRFDVDRWIEECQNALAQSPVGGAMREVVARAVTEPAALLDALGEPTRAAIQNESAREFHRSAARLFERNEDRMKKLEAKVAIVTGASRGIGKAIAVRFAAEGASVVCMARTLDEGDHTFEGSLNTTVRAIQESGGRALALACDVSDPEACERAVSEARKTFGPIDVLVNNAALTYFLPIADMPVAKWLKSFSVNVHGPFYMSKLVLTDMLARRQGAIVNISSGAAIGPGRGPYPGNARRAGTLYGAEKAALERFTQGLAAEVYDRGVSVTCVSPSLIVATPGVLHHKLVRSAEDPNCEPEHLMADAALLLATEPLDKVTGRVTYSQQILKEFGWIESASGVGVERKGSGYSQI